MTQSLAFEVHLHTTYDDAIERVTAALKAEGFGVLTRIDVDKTLKEKINADFRRYVILGACDPTLAHKALSHRADVGLMLPCNVTVEAANGGAIARIVNPDTILQVGNLTADVALREVAAEARERLERVAGVLATSG